MKEGYSKDGKVLWHDDYVVALLEQIAFNTQRYGAAEFDTYIGRIRDASYKRSAEALHGDLRARSETRTGYVSGHDTGGDAQVRVDQGSGLAAPQEEVAPKKDGGIAPPKNKWGIKR